MARPRDHKKHLATAAEDLIRSLTRFVDLAGDAMATARATDVGNGSPPRGASGDSVGIRRRGPGKGNPKLKSKLKAHWAAMSPTERKARIEKMHAWRTKK